MRNLLKLKTFCFACILLLNFSCQKEKFNEINDIRAEPSIVLSSDSDSQELYEGALFNLTIEFTAQAGIESIQIVKDGKIIEEITPVEGKVSENYNIEHLIDGSLQVGDVILYEFKITDRNGDSKDNQFTITIGEKPPLEPTFSITDQEIDGKTYKALIGAINIDTVLSNEHQFIIKGKVVVEPQVILTIQEGTTLYAESMASFIVSSYAKINAKGSQENPIIFTSIKEINGSAQSGDWVGVHINGLSSVSSIAGSLTDEIGMYGGSDNKDSSGVLEFIRIEYAGASFAGSTGALNFNAVGSNTFVENINVYEANGHGIRTRGGSPNLRYLFVDNPNGRALRWQDGYTGFVQHFVAIYRSNPSSAVTAIEGYDAESNPILSNITIRSLGNNAYSNTRGIRLRDGTLGKIYNALIMNVATGVRANDQSGEISSGDLVFANSMLWNNSTRDYHGDATAFTKSEFNNGTSEVSLNGYIGVQSTGAKSPHTIDTWFTDASYIGAVSSTTNWTKDWIK